MSSLIQQTILTHYQHWQQHEARLTGFSVLLDWSAQTIRCAGRTLAWELAEHAVAIEQPQSWPLQSECFALAGLHWPDDQLAPADYQHAQAEFFHQWVQPLYQLRQSQQIASLCMLDVTCSPAQAHSQCWSAGARLYLNAVDELT